MSGYLTTDNQLYYMTCGQIYVFLFDLKLRTKKSSSTNNHSYQQEMCIPENTYT